MSSIRMPICLAAMLFAAPSLAGDYAVIGDRHISTEMIDAFISNQYKNAFDNMPSDKKMALGAGFIADMFVIADAARHEKLAPDPSVLPVDPKSESAAAIGDVLSERPFVSAWYRARIDDNKATVTEDDITKIKDRFAHRQYHAHQVVVGTKDKADAIIKKLKAGGSFAAASKESVDQSTGLKDGDLGWFESGGLEPELAAAVEKLKAGEMSGPVQAKDGWHVIRIDEIKQPPSFSDTEIKQMVHSQQSGAEITTLLQKLRHDAKVTWIGQTPPVWIAAAEDPVASPAASLAPVSPAKVQPVVAQPVVAQPAHVADHPVNAAPVKVVKPAPKPHKVVKPAPVNPPAAVSTDATQN